MQFLLNPVQILDLHYFQVHQLEDPIVLPSYYEVREGMDQYYLEINYVTNKQEQYTLEYISFSDFTIFNENNFVEPLGDYTPDTIEELTHHYVKKAIFQLSQEEWGYLLDHPEEVANAKAYFVWPQTNVEGKDIRTPIALQLVDKRGQSELVVDLDWQSGGGSSAGDFYENVILNETVTFDALHVPPGMEGIEIKFYTTKDNDSTKNKELKRTKRALWLARANRAQDICDMADVCVSAFEANKVQKVWQPIANKCRTYADKFKEE